MGVPPNHPNFNVISTINQPFSGTPIYENPHMRRENLVIHQASCCTVQTNPHKTGETKAIFGWGDFGNLHQQQIQVFQLDKSGRFWPSLV